MNKPKLSIAQQKQLYTSVETNDLSSMTADQMKDGIKDYKLKIDDTRKNILNTMDETIKLSNYTGNELNEHTESLNRINNELDIMEHKLTISERLIANITSWFSYFKSTPSTVTPQIQSESKIKTKFEAKSVDVKPSNHNSKKEKKEYFSETDRLKAEEEDDKKKDKEFYDKVFAGLDVLDSNAKAFNKILTEHSKMTDVIVDKVDKSDERMKKTNDRVKNVK